MELKIGCEESPLGEMCFEGMGTVPKWRFRCWHYVKCVLRALMDLQRGFQVLALGGMCFEGIGAVEKGITGVGTGQNM